MKKIIILAIAFVSICATQNILAVGNTDLYAYCSPNSPVLVYIYSYNKGTGKYSNAGSLYVRKENGKLIAYNPFDRSDYSVVKSDRPEYTYMVEMSGGFTAYFNL